MNRDHPSLRTFWGERRGNIRGKRGGHNRCFYFFTQRKSKNNTTRIFFFFT